MPSKLEIVLSVLSQGMENFSSAGNHIDGLKKKSEGLSSANTALGKSVVGMLAPLATAATAMMALHSAMDLGDSIRNQSDALAMSTQAVQEWNYAAKQSGGSAESVTNSFGKLTKNIYEASTGNEKLAQTFKNWNISLTDTSGNLRDVESITNDTMRAIAGIKDPIERAGVATELLGKGSKDLLPLLAGGTEAMNAQRKAAGDLGQVLSESAIKSLDDAGDAMDTFNMSMKVANAEMISNAIPALELLAVAATKVMSAVGDAAIGWEWLLKGKTEFDAKMKEGDAITKEIQEFAALKKEYQETIATQEALRKSGGSLFSKNVLEEAQAGLEAVNDTLHQMNTPKAAAPNEGLKKAQQEAQDEKAKAAKKAAEEQKKLDAAAAAAHRKYLNDEVNFSQMAKEANASVNEKFSKEASDKDKKESSDKLARAKKLDSDIDKMALAGEKDETKRRQLGIKQEQRDIDKAYKEQIKDANGNAKEIAKINELKNLSIRASNESYNEWFKQSELTKKELARETGRATVESVIGMLQTAGAKHKEAAIAYKAMAISMTIIDTIKGAQSSYNALAGITVVGPFLGAAAAIAAGVAGAVRVNEIRKQAFASGSNGPIDYGTFADVGEMGRERIYLPKGSQVENHHKTTQQINNNQKKTTNLNVYVQNTDGSYDKKFVRGLRNGTMDYATRLLKKKMGIV